MGINGKTKNKIYQKYGVETTKYGKRKYFKKTENIIEITKKNNFEILNEPYLWLLRIFYTLEGIGMYYLFTNLG